jgi:hypothetical protein
MDKIDIANMSTLDLHTPSGAPASSNESAFSPKQGEYPSRHEESTREKGTDRAEIGAISLFRDTGNDAQRTTPTRTVTNRERRPGCADLMGRRLGLVYGHLDARGRVPDVDRLRKKGRCVNTCVSISGVCLPWRWQDRSTCASGGCGGYPVANDRSDGPGESEASSRTGSLEKIGPPGTFFTRKAL